MAKKKIDEILSTTFDEVVDGIELGVMRLYVRGNVCMGLGDVETREQLDNERPCRPNFSLLKAKK